MSDFERENEDVFQIVRDNPRRRGVIRDIGYILPADKAQRFAAYEASQNRCQDRNGVSMIVLAFLAIIVLTVIALI